MAYINALDKHETLNALPGHGSVESVQACSNTVWGEVSHGHVRVYLCVCACIRGFYALVCAPLHGRIAMAGG